MQIGLATFLGWVGGLGGWGWGAGGGEYTICLGRTSRSSTNIFHMYMM